MSAARPARHRQCKHLTCERRAVRQGLCPDHWAALWGADRPAPYPIDLEPQSWRERRHRRLHGVAP